MSRFGGAGVKPRGSRYAATPRINLAGTYLKNLPLARLVAPGGSKGRTIAGRIRRCAVIDQ